MAEMLIGVYQIALRGPLEVFDLPHPAGQWVPSGEILGHQPQTVDSKRLTLPTTSLIEPPVVGGPIV
jgi:hypothetical protein